MTSALNNAGIYTSFSGLTELKAGAREQSPAARKEVARQFEAMFIQIMLKSMRDASVPGSEEGSEQVRFYQEMFDQQIALDLARNKSMGLADSFERHLGDSVEKAPDSSDRLLRREGFVARGDHGNGIAHESVKEASVTTPSSSWVPDSPEEFVERLWPAAQKVASGLGLHPEVLLAQAALETGWGKMMPADESGSSMNLFGIKADSRWEGQRVGVSTLEYRDGSAHRERADFRSYDSPEESMEDYARFLKENPRYEEALKNAGDAHRYLDELQKAGYATDPQYARKIRSIMDSKRFTGIVTQLRAG
ncbi:flagellar assembly peptidoglycan hydrolase FlgJ [Thiolapillus sp.]